ncbi:MAG: hypothetical protein KGJ02_06135 [Verrucomicrobiota bacterium]|nr:hypothetical protein [Verrucomicrobiota bacterium]
MKPVNRKRIEKTCGLEESKPSYALFVYSPEIYDQIDSFEIDADFVVALSDNGRGDLIEEVPKRG